MRYFRNIFFALAAFLWLPMSAHCQLESVSGVEFFRCAGDEQTPGAGKDCEGGGCCTVEKSQYKSGQTRVSIPSPDLLPQLLATLATITDAEADQASSNAFAAVPPELPRCWQFVFRTASPPRAPSFAS